MHPDVNGELPSVAPVEGGTQNREVQYGLSNGPERGSATPELSAQAPHGGPGQPQPASPQQAAADPAVAQQAALGTPPTADDTDLIEKEWVLKAKEIVERTRNDPYLQNEEMHRIKADYMKKRYNKDLKLNEG